MKVLILAGTLFSCVTLGKSLLNLSRSRFICKTGDNVSISASKGGCEDPMSSHTLKTNEQPTENSVRHSNIAWYDDDGGDGATGGHIKSTSA